MLRHEWMSRGLPAVLLVLLASPAGAQSFRVQCPTGTITHPTAPDADPGYAGPTQLKCSVDGGCVGSGAPNAGTRPQGAAPSRRSRGPRGSNPRS